MLSDQAGGVERTAVRFGTMTDDYARDITRVQSIDAVPKILDVVCKSTGMGFAAVARVSESRWICCAVRDEISFGLQPGGELPVETTICHEIKQHQQAIVIGNVAESPEFRCHATPALYGFKSYISMPIFRKDGTFFGTLCAIDPKPALLTPQIVDTFRLFAELIAVQLEALDRLENTQTDLAHERATAELREQFIAVLGHDLRNPLASIGAGARILRRGVRDERELEILDLMQNSVRRMSELIHNVMDFARSRLGGGLILTKSKVEIQPVLEQVLSEIKSSSPEVRFDVSLSIALPVACDAGRLGQLFSNLVGNAVAYGDLTLPVTVVATTDVQQFELTVSNAGDPIAPDALQRLFSPFVRGDNEQRATNGLGLGLFIASEIARAHHGRLTATSTMQQTSFTLRMPLDG